jgi:hypothetical protein
VSDPGQTQETLTFVVRLWRETGADHRARWRGRVEHAGTPDVGYVDDVAGVSRLIERWTRLAEEREDRGGGLDRAGDEERE